MGTTRWTLAGIASVIEVHFGVTYSPSGVWYLLHRMRRREPERAKPTLVT